MQPKLRTELLQILRLLLQSKDWNSGARDNLYAMYAAVGLGAGDALKRTKSLFTWTDEERDRNQVILNLVEMLRYYYEPTKYFPKPNDEVFLLRVKAVVGQHFPEVVYGEEPGQGEG